MSEDTNTSATDAAPAADEDVFEFEGEDGEVSRFSKSEAEAAGWVFVHERGEFTTTDSSTQGRTTTTAPRLVAERYVSFPGRASTLITETAETMGKLLERIHLYEEHLKRVGVEQTAPEVDNSSALTVRSLRAEGAENDPSVNESDTLHSDELAGDVILPANPDDLDSDETFTVTSAEFAARSRNDVLIVNDENGNPVQQFLSGSVSDAERGVDNHLARKAAVEFARTEDAPALDVETEQITYDVLDTVDAPGQSAGGVVIVRKGESLEDAAIRMDESAKALEDARVEATEGGTQAPPEEEDELAGVDVGLARRGDLESEIPDTGSVDTQPDERVQGGVEIQSESPTTAGVDAASAAGEEAALEARDNADNAEEADGADTVQKVEDASADAAQDAQDELKSADQSAEDSTGESDTSEVNPTESSPESPSDARDGNVEDAFNEEHRGIAKPGDKTHGGL